MPYIVLIFKVLFMCILGIAIRGTLPRYRFDQFTQLNWKHFIFVWIAYLTFSSLFFFCFI